MALGSGNKGEPVLAVRLGKRCGTVRRRLQRAARLRGMTLSAFVRWAAVHAADETLQSASRARDVSSHDAGRSVEVAA